MTATSDFGVTADSKPVAQWDGVGVFYTIFSVVWTAILFSGMIFLYIRRDMPILRIRGLPLSFGAVILMHMYWLAVQTGYVYGVLMPETAEFWIMGIWFPFGVALFHASNSRFLYIAKAQQKYLNSNRNSIDSSRSSKYARRRGFAAAFQQLDYTNKMLLLVGLGMGFQLFLTSFMFLISRKFHASFGIPGTGVHGTYMEKKTAAGRGWEWWPSVFWQLFWAWFVAPYILFKSRNVRDTQGWRFQTIACCLSNLHATPMWLIALYVPGMAPVNKYWIPPQWIAVSIMLLEIFTVFVPVWEVIKHQTLTRETLESIARWESRQKKGNDKDGGKSLNSASTGTTNTNSWIMPRVGRAASVHSTGSSVLTMDALEHTLAKNPEPLQEFSALRDFSGENIAFLTRVREWRATYFPSTLSGSSQHGSEKKQESSETTVSREAFESGLHIYLDFISGSAAEFQVNLSSTDFKNLQAIFEGAATIMYGSDRSSPDPATPFDDFEPRSMPPSTVGNRNGSETAIVPGSGDSSSDSTTLNIRYWGEIPEAFGESVFDDAESSIKYLVLTNTWPKFIRERRSFDTARELESQVGN